MSTVAAAYSASARAWQAGPARLYDRLAEVLVGHSPVPLSGRRVVDVGAGTGAAGRAATSAGAASVVAVDAAVGMLSLDRGLRPPAVAGDALSLPFRDDAFSAAVAAFSLNHVTDPVAGLREMARVCEPGAPLLAASYATDDAHPVKGAVESALAARGWRADAWYVQVRETTVPRLGTVERCAAVAAAAGIRAEVRKVRVRFPELGPDDLVAWRLGMAQHADFVAHLDAAAREALVTDALDRLGDPPVLERSIVVIAATGPPRERRPAR